MKPQVFMSKRNGQLAVGLPLYIGRVLNVDSAMATEKWSYSIDMDSYEGIGWAVFVGDECQGLFVEAAIDILPLERLGDL